VGKREIPLLLATVDYAFGQIVWQEDEQYTAETFLNFLNQVVAFYPTGKIVIGQRPRSSCQAHTAVSG